MSFYHTHATLRDMCLHGIVVIMRDGGLDVCLREWLFHVGMPWQGGRLAISNLVVLPYGHRSIIALICVCELRLVYGTGFACFIIRRLRSHMCRRIHRVTLISRQGSHYDSCAPVHGGTPAVCYECAFLGFDAYIGMLTVCTHNIMAHRLVYAMLRLYEDPH